ncbi:hypothetical protein ACIQVO_16765 [Streptomyces sp. NPDC101062]|uniref:hypothetical protein n=1 Tax=unclassified Streptomyces TaxID=2593676 RepID=UPI0037FA7137
MDHSLPSTVPSNEGLGGTCPGFSVPVTLFAADQEEEDTVSQYYDMGDRTLWNPSMHSSAEVWEAALRQKARELGRFMAA